MRIVFQGDSITDTGRNTDNGSVVSIGQGYAMLCAARIGADMCQEHEFINRGISGNRIVDVYARIKTDCWNLKPDVLSILIGVNDVWHEYFSSENGVDAVRFEKMLDILLSDTKERFPEIKFMILEPFVLHGTATDECWDSFHSEVLKRAEACKKLAVKYGAVFIPLQEKLEAASKNAPEAYWLADGVHPTPQGHQLIADEWIAAFNSLL